MPDDPYTAALLDQLALGDDIQQLLVGASLRIDGVLRRGRGGLIEQDLQKAVDMIGEALSASRLLTAELIPPVLHQNSMATAARWLGRCRRRGRADLSPLARSRERGRG